jgi:hypothetical protein
MFDKYYTCVGEGIPREFRNKRDLTKGCIHGFTSFESDAKIEDPDITQVGTGLYTTCPYQKLISILFRIDLVPETCRMSHCSCADHAKLDIGSLPRFSELKTILSSCENLSDFFSEFDIIMLNHYALSESI